MAINKVVLLGRIANDLVLRSSKSGKDVLNICMAVDRRKDGVDFIDCTAWEHTARFIYKHMEKGSPLAIVGQIRTNNKQAEDGKWLKGVFVNIEEASFAGNKKAAGFESDPDMTQVLADDEMFGELPY